MCDQAVWLHTLNSWDQNSIKYPLLPHISDIYLPNYPKFTKFYSSLANFDPIHGTSPALVAKFQLLFQCFLVAYGGIEVILSTPGHCIHMYAGLKVKYNRVYTRGGARPPKWQGCDDLIWKGPRFYRDVLFKWSAFTASWVKKTFLPMILVMLYPLFGIFLPKHPPVRAARLCQPFYGSNNPGGILWSLTIICSCTWTYQYVSKIEHFKPRYAQNVFSAQNAQIY